MLTTVQRGLIFRTRLELRNLIAALEADLGVEAAHPAVRHGVEMGEELERMERGEREGAQ